MSNDPATRPESLPHLIASFLDLKKIKLLLCTSNHFDHLDLAHAYQIRFLHIQWSLNLIIQLRHQDMQPKSYFFFFLKLNSRPV